MKLDEKSWQNESISLLIIEIVRYNTKDPNSYKTHTAISSNYIVLLFQPS